MVGSGSHSRMLLRVWLAWSTVERTVLLNNDLSGGIPPVLENLHEQYLLPPLHAGWAVRRKSNHFSCYDDVAKKFSKLVEIDLRPLRGALAAVSCPFPDSFAKRCRLGGAKEEALEYEVEDPAILW